MILNKEEREMAFEKLDNLRNEMLENLSEMEEIIKELAGENRMVFERAKAYWHTHVKNNLSADADSFLGSMINFESTFKELKEQYEEDNNDS